MKRLILTGFDKSTGQQRWLHKRNYQVPNENDNAYTTPVFFEHQSRPAFLVWGADHLTAHSAADGSLLWSCGGFNPKETGNWPAIATPVVHGGVAVVPVGRDDRGQGRIEGVRLDGSGCSFRGARNGGHQGLWTERVRPGFQGFAAFRG